MMQFNSVFNEGAQNYYYSRHFLLFYPVDDFGTRADMVAVDHPEVVQDYRDASDARRRHHDSDGVESTTEELRRAMVHYRALFERLVGDASTYRAHDEAHDDVYLWTAEDRADHAPGRHAG